MSEWPFPPDRSSAPLEGDEVRIYPSPTDRLKFLPDEEQENICPDCHVVEGEVHSYPCDIEQCPLCGGQLTNCGCLSTFGSDMDIDEDEIERAEADRLARMENVGRVPWIAFFPRCGRCGCRDAYLGRPFVDRRLWDHYIQMDQRDQSLCKDCWERIRRVTDERSSARFW